MRNWIILLVIVAVVGWFGFQKYWSTQLDPADPSNKDVQAFVITKGETTGEIVQDLKDKGLIKNITAFTQLLKETGADAKLQAGDYKLSPSMSAQEVIKAFQTGTSDSWVTLLEGWRDEEIARKLNQDLGMDPQAFLKVAREGHMFPDTYLINKDATVETVASLLKNTFATRYSDDLQSQITAKGLTAEQGLILASIVEREARTSPVKKQVASILLKRLKIGMALNVDASIQYAKDSQNYARNPNLKFWQPVTQADYKIDSPYNTYLHAGLPPTPICNPGLASLQAVAAADSSTPYLYYYHDSQGNSYYAKTLDEHNANVANHP